MKLDAASLKRHWKWAAAAVLLAVAIPLGLYHFVWRWNTPEGTLRRIFKAISENRPEEALSYVDSQSELALYWKEDRGGIKTRALRALNEWQVSFDLELKTVKKGEEAEVRLVDGTMKISSRDPSSKAAYPVSLRSLELIFFLHKKDGKWLLTDINYDLEELAEELSF